MKDKERKPIPAFISQSWGGARAYKADKRRLLKKMEKLYLELRRGSAYIPGFPSHISKIAQGIAEMREAMKAKKWGR